MATPPDTVASLAGAVIATVGGVVAVVSVLPGKVTVTLAPNGLVELVVIATPVMGSVYVLPGISGAYHSNSGLVSETSLGFMFSSSEPEAFENSPARRIVTPCSTH